MSREKLEDQSRYESTRAWAQQTLGDHRSIEEIVPLKGATSSSVYLITSWVGKERRKCVLRLFTDKTWLADEPDLAEHEAAVLKKASAAGLPAPKLLGCTSDSSESGVPAILMSFIEGKVVLRPDDFEHWLKQLAQLLAQVHDCSAQDLSWEYESWTGKHDLVPPVWSGRPDLWEKAINVVSGSPPTEPQVFIHRDFHPTNVLWKSGQLCGVVDWVNGCRGPAAADLAHCRANLALMYGPSIAEHLLRLYKDIVDGYVHNSYWDIDALLDWPHGPRYYSPWRDFGLGKIGQQVLRERADSYLQSILEQGW